MSAGVTIKIDRAKVTALVERVKTALPEDGEYLGAFLQRVWPLFEELEKKDASIGRLKSLAFGAKTEKTSAVFAPEEPQALGGDEEPPATKERRRGHGRHAAEDYVGAKKIVFKLEKLKHGDRCPDCSCGNVYEIEPMREVRLRGQAPIAADLFEQQTVRCGACGKIFRAEHRDGKKEKYDETAVSMIGLLRYGMGLPFNRIEKLQAGFGIPLPVATQWEVVSENSEALEPAYQELIRQGAQGDVLHNDDTPSVILERVGKRWEKRCKGKEGEEERRAVFTSGIVSLCDEHTIALFFTGPKHAGENLQEVLKNRAKELSPPIQMSDGLSRNRPGDFETIEANCIAHSRRKYVDVAGSFPKECREVLETLRVVYHNDAVAKERAMSAEERLRWHQEHSGPLMEKLKAWLDVQTQGTERTIEPNSGLGEAIAYMHKRWDRLTLFLRVPGAPLDNNIVERVLKKAILHRRNSLFYRTDNGARVGDLFMTLIHTAELSGVSAFDYLTELQRNAERVRAAPAEWMPWNYKATIATTPTG